MRHIANALFDRLRKLLDIDVVGTWLIARERVRGLRQARHSDTLMRQFNLIIIGGESGFFGERQNTNCTLARALCRAGRSIDFG